MTGSAPSVEGPCFRLPLPEAGSEKGASSGAKDFADRLEHRAERFSERVRTDTDWRFGREPPEVAREEALFGAVSAGAILVIIAASFLRYPDSPTLMGDYFRSMGALNVYFRPPTELLDLGSFFFAAVGLWSFVMAVMRLLPSTASGRGWTASWEASSACTSPISCPPTRR